MAGDLSHLPRQMTIRRQERVRGRCGRGGRVRDGPEQGAGAGGGVGRLGRPWPARGGRGAAVGGGSGCRGRGVTFGGAEHGRDGVREAHPRRPSFLP